MKWVGEPERPAGGIYVSSKWRLCDAVSEVFDPTLLPDSLAGFDSEIVDLFASFLSDFHCNASSEDMSAYRIPHGRLNGNILHSLHSPPETPGQPRRWSSFHFGACSVRILTAIFPDPKTDALFHDYFCKRVLMIRPDGTRKTNSGIHEYHIPKYHRFSRPVFEQSSAELIVVWGRPARRWFKKEFNVEGDEKYGIVDGVVIGEKPAINMFFSGPLSFSHTQNTWADIDVLEEVRDIIETPSIERDIDVDLELLEKRLRKREELKAVDVPRTPKVQMREERWGSRT
ncbi:hypothetical protein LTR97_010407 [Elasticomyces elasticus]|uniref:Uncharacterized protein n=1 Tax=Elasticomyces elasticus TaxID=574655 RepID=A0AAN7VY77_9PEZI|nr:hypothetical protein LTR97_010407 [Elasticomyces elasticus]KAK5716098.1 hypothetical protein LTR15_009923 [Elasticomyces elasticus]